MTFFQWQKDARRKTGRLVVLMGLAVFSLIAGSNLVYALFRGYKSEQPWTTWFTLDTFFIFSCLIGSVVLCASVTRTLTLRSKGGKAVAESLGGKRVDPATEHFHERRLLNIVEEMAIASGTPVPDVYVLHGEKSINAFAAGFTLQDAVIGVTRGTMEQLTRDELEGVIAHEFSHIIHGDMRLNIRLIGIVYGITMLAEFGYILMRAGGSSRSRDGTPLAIAGLGLMIIGYSGAFFGNLIKASVSRTREYLADASALQYTRNNEGIANALSKIGGSAHSSLLQSAHAPDVSHMMFGKSVGGFFNALFSTHPPLEDRIRKLMPDWNGKYITPVLIEADTDTPSATATKTSTGTGSIKAETLTAALNAMGAPNASHMAYATTLLSALPMRLAGAVHQKDDSVMLLMALMLDDNPDMVEKRATIIRKHYDEETLNQTIALYNTIDSVSDSLVLVELTLPTLRTLPRPQQKQLLQTLLELAKADGKTSPNEWALLAIVQHHLGSNRHKKTQMPFDSYGDVRKIGAEAAQIISALISMSGMDKAAKQACYKKTMTLLGLEQQKPPRKMSYRDLSNALEAANRLQPEAKEKLLHACCQCIEHDGQVELTEAQTLRAMAVVMECPIPPLLTNST